MDRIEEFYWHGCFLKCMLRNLYNSSEVSNVNDTIETAIVKWIRHIQAELQSTYGRQIPENEIMKIMTEEVNNLPVDIAKSIQGLLRDFVNDLEGNITELGYDMDYTNIIYVGGGASIARKYNTKRRSNVAYDCDIKANAKGYEFLAEQMVKRWRNE